MLGDSGVGKSSIILRYSENQFQDTIMASIGVEFKIKNIELNNKKIKMQIVREYIIINFKKNLNSFFTIKTSGIQQVKKDIEQLQQVIIEAQIVLQ